MTKIGYARTSTVEQNLDSQIIALKTANCEIIRTEQKSGNNLEDRKELNNILDFIHKDEYLVVTRIDRLARSLKDLQIIVDRLKAKGAHLYAIEQPVDTSTATGKAFFDMLGVFAEFETNLRRISIFICNRERHINACAIQRGFILCKLTISAVPTTFCHLMSGLLRAPMASLASSNTP